MRPASDQVVEVDGGVGEVGRHHVQHALVEVPGVSTQPHGLPAVVHGLRRVILPQRSQVSHGVPYSSLALPIIPLTSVSET